MFGLWNEVVRHYLTIFLKGSGGVGIPTMVTMLDKKKRKVYNIRDSRRYKIVLHQIFVYIW